MDIVVNGAVAAMAGGMVAIGVWIIVHGATRVMQKKEKHSG